MVDKIKELESHYCPPLDPATLYAITSDFNLEDDADLKSAKEILDVLKSSASADDTNGFDPSGNSNPKDDDRDLTESVFSQSEDTDVLSNESSGITEATSSLDAFTFEDKSTYDRGIDSMTIDEKKALLTEMFHSLKPFDVEFTLKKQKGDFGSTVEGLLNQQFLQEEAAANGGLGTLKGIDGFAAPAYSARKGKGKGKGRGKKSISAVELEERLVEGSSSSVNRWQQGHNDVRFITDRTTLNEALVKSTYNSSGHSLRATIIALCKKSLANDLRCFTDPDDALVQSRMVDLATEFKSVPLPHIKTIILLTHPLFIAAKELAEIISTGQKENIVPQYASTNVETSHPTPGSDEDESSSFLAAPDLPVNSSYTALRSSAFAQASAAYRKSRSSPLMGGAAAHYASMGHAANAAIKRERAVAANVRVAGQSASDSCDLHGVTIDDARRIAKQYVERWWDNRKEWAREGKAMGGGSSTTQFRIVVGRGSHSAGGKGKLGPAVSKMLKAEGWRVDEQVGEIIVRGRARR